MSRLRRSADIPQLRFCNISIVTCNIIGHCSGTKPKEGYEFSHHTTYTPVIERYRTTRRSELGFRYRHSRSHRQGPRRGGVPPNRRAILRVAVYMYGWNDVDPRSPGGSARERSHRAVVYLRCDGTGLVVEWADSGVRRLSAGNLHDRPRRRRTEPLSGHGGDL